ncbi:unnamed protein product [Medioppia subpectinata]|uniref:Doublecortin domain-containing protein n=1 Tax=Medioppia subpectinata TaxID=1979941 RepID=A0A7R9KKG6_9ACAR|nr:unnamed protein product [Medioppia subpectinata]CAG2103989.1 unnamed protein product [Medioppia subpectinata]
MAKESQLLDESVVNNNNNNEDNCHSCSHPVPSADHKTVTTTTSISPSTPHNTPHNRVSLQRLSAEKRGKRVKFFLNGDKYFKGFVYAFNDKTIRTFDALIQDLNRLFRHHVSLPSIDPNI